MRRAELILIAVLLATSSAGGAVAQSIDAGASILFFPLVVVDSEHDTVIRLANRSTRVSFARCEYSPAGGGSGGEATTFTLLLQSRQPTQWQASRGRAVDPSDLPCEESVNDCPGAGLDPGGIPPLPEGFRGDLLCVQVDRSHAPTPGNALRGSATLSDTSGDTANYEGIGLRGLAQNDGDDVLCLGGAVGEDCPRGPEYAACPASWLIGLRADGTPQQSGAGAPTIRNTLAVTTCSRRSGGGGATLNLFVTNEFEQRLSASTVVQRNEEIPLADFPILQRDVLGSDFAQLRVRPAGPPSGGVVIVALSDRADAAGNTAGGAEAVLPYPEGAHDQTDRIVLSTSEGEE